MDDRLDLDEETRRYRKYECSGRDLFAVGIVLQVATLVLTAGFFAWIVVHVR